MASPYLVVLISDDVACAGVVRDRLRALEGVRLRVFGSVSEALARTAAAAPGLILVHLNGGVTDDELAYLLGRAALPRRAVPVLALADGYDAGRGATLFRLGVTDYLSRADHLDRFAALVGAHVVRRPSPPPGWVEAAPGPRPECWAVSSPAP